MEPPMTNTNIEWTDATWNPVTGCSRVSEGCRHCYIERTMPFRMAGRKVGDAIQLHYDRLDAPLHWKKPRRVFVNSMSDLFHEDVPDEFIVHVFEIMAACPQHEFQVLTKRPERIEPVLYGETGNWYLGGGGWLPNVLIGFSAEDQATFDKRLRIFQPRGEEKFSWAYGIRLFASLEPLLGPLDISAALIGDPHLSWVIVGGESGPQARSCNVHWIRSLLRQCRTANVSCFVKQLGSCVVDRNDAGFEGDTDVSWPMDTRFDQEWSEQNYQGTLGQVRLRDRKGGDPSEWPEDLRVREYPSTTKGVAS